MARKSHRSVKKDWLTRASQKLAKNHARSDLQPYAVWVRPAEVIGRGWYNVCYRVNDGPVEVVKPALCLEDKTWDAYCRYQAQFQKRFRSRVEAPGRRNSF